MNSNTSPYRTVAVASTFSPRFVQVLAEAKRIRDRFAADLHLIYVGERDETTAGKFQEVLSQLDLPRTVPIHYEKGDPAEGILRSLQQKKIDLIVAGALEKEVVLHPFLGNVARRLVRDAGCSVMLFTHPGIEAKPLRKMVFVADNYSDHARGALQKAFHLAAAEKIERLFVVRILTTFDKARASREKGEAAAAVDDETELENFVLSTGATEVPIEARCIRGNTGLVASDFVESVEADMLVVAIPAPESKDAALPANIAWITDVIPCNLWVIR